ncbi:hypothetical protein HPULCUR_001563 [Helicostylum pulchrum]|uniref:Mediator complex subunit 16 n=1 Tax=Helicostylum pulchrum TaxID=562976 RepID=A0ABP9XN33_9FUNG
MVELLKRKKARLSNKRPTSDKASRYPPSYHFSALTYKQAPEALSISPQSVVVSVPTQPNPTQFNTITGDIFNLDGSLHRSCVKLVEEHHKHYTITHLEWNKKGDTIASIDETGHLALWHIKSSVNDWQLTYKVNMKQPLAAFLWLNSDRSYNIDSNQKYIRQPLNGPRNPFGQLGFITISVHGEITVHYQRNGSIFSTFSTPMPNIGRREISRADAGCFGMSLAGLDDWERISHAAIALHDDGIIYLATHNASIQPKSVSIHTIKIKFPVRTEKGAIECKPLTSLKIQGQDLLKDNNVTQMIFKKGVSTVELVLGLGDEVDKEFNGFVASWQLKNIQQSIPSDFGMITNDRTSGIMILGRFVSCLKSTSTGQIIVGLSDGSIHMQSATESGIIKSNNKEDMIDSIDASYWTVVESHKTSDGCVDPIIDIVLSPNETHLIYMFSSVKMGVARITNDDISDDYVKKLTQKLQLCLLNDVDFVDLISELVRMSKLDGSKDKADDIIQDVLTTYEIQCGSPELPDWSLAKLEKAYGLAMATYQRLPEKKIQSVNLSRALQLPVILECFISSCSSDYKAIMDALEKENIDDENVKLEFDADSLWSLISLSNWTRDYVRWILREWNVLFNSIRPKNSRFTDISELTVHAVLLLHKDSNVTLSKILKMLHYFIRYTSTNNFQLRHFTETQGLLQRYTSTLLNDEIITIKDTIDFLNALNELKQNTAEVKNRWSILLTSNIKSFDLTEIKNISKNYKDRCAKPSIYLEKEEMYVYDVIRKRRISDNVQTNQCARCKQPVISIGTLKDMNDPCSSAQWCQSLGRRCVCGGLFH